MRKTAFVIIASLLPILCSANDNLSLKVKEIKLQNGLTVWLNEDHSQPKIYGELVVKAGAKDCPNTGIAHYLEHVLFKGTQKIGTINFKEEKQWLDSISLKYNELSQAKDPQQRLLIQKDISRLSQKAADYAIPNEFYRLTSQFGGSKLNASTSWDRTEYHNTFSPQYLEQWCWLNSERMINPVFRLFQGELETVYEEKNRAADNLATGAMEKIMETAFKGHPYEYPIIGSTENLKNPRLSDMEEFFRKYYVAGNMGLILSGDFNASTIAPLLENTFGRLPGGEAPKTTFPTLQPFSGETVNVKLNIPILKAVALLFRGPLTSANDFRATELAMLLLTNDNQTGMLDSLRTAHKVMMAAGTNFAFNEAGAVGLFIIPKLPFGSKKKAEQLCWQQIERLKKGDFSNAKLEELKLELIRQCEHELETIDGRAEVMSQLFSENRSWIDYLKQLENIKNITKTDVVAAANRYLLDDKYMRYVKKFGSYPKDKVSQPNYKPVVPKHSKEKSAYATEMEKMPHMERSPRLIDLNKDVQIIKEKNFTLYHVNNPVNDLFSLTLKWQRGTLNDARLNLLPEFLTELGTDSLSKHKLGEAWQQLGTTINIDCSENAFTISLEGFEKNLEPSINLLRHMITSLKSDKDVLKDLKKEYAISRKQMARENSEVMSMMIKKIMLGEKSEFMLMPTAKEVNKLTGDDFIQLFNDVREYPCDVLYSGNIDAKRLAGICNEYLPQPTGNKPAPDNNRRVKEYNETTVYFYNMPRARQTYIGVYGSFKPNMTNREEALMHMWNQYFGGGMSSLLFQEIREFRSMAYSTGSQCIGTNRALHNDNPSAYIAYLGTQGDKSMMALAVLDSLLSQMPMDEQRAQIAKQEVLNDINNYYPTFRELPNYASSIIRKGFKEDPRTSRAQVTPTLTSDDIMDFYKKNVQQQPRVIFIIGNKKLLNFEQLEKYGKVVEMKKADIMR